MNGFYPTRAVKNSSLPYSVRGEPRVDGQWVAGSPARVYLGRRVREQGQIVLLHKDTSPGGDICFKGLPRRQSS